jgi:hypothetical protein
VTAAEEYTINHGDFGCLGVRWIAIRHGDGRFRVLRFIVSIIEEYIHGMGTR